MHAPNSVTIPVYLAITASGPNKADLGRYMSFCHISKNRASIWRANTYFVIEYSDLEINRYVDMLMPRQLNGYHHFPVMVCQRMFMILLVG